MLYPLKFKPVFLDKIWGGQKIRTRLGLDFAPLTNCGEVWALSGVPGCQTKIRNGFLKGNELNEILEVYMDELVGEQVYNRYGNEFPLLIKFIDANDYLSIQVHPDDALAQKRNIGRGKTEMWYILDAEPGAGLIRGFSREVTPELYLEYLEKKRLREILQEEKVKTGDAYYIPAGTVHALGPGILLAEIQQTSDTTYRIYDWDRVDDHGKSRELHIDLALEAIDFRKYHPGPGEHPSGTGNYRQLVTGPYFKTSFLNLDSGSEKYYSDNDSCMIFIGTEGTFSLITGDHRVEVKTGEVALMPAIIDSFTVVAESKSSLLEVRVV